MPTNIPRHCAVVTADPISSDRTAMILALQTGQAHTDEHVARPENPETPWAHRTPTRPVPETVTRPHFRMRSSSEISHRTPRFSYRRTRRSDDEIEGVETLFA